MKRIFAILLVVTFLTPTSAYSHTSLVSSSPKANAKLTKTPQVITLTFGENLLKLSNNVPARVTLTNKDKSQIPLKSIMVRKNVLNAMLMDGNLLPGTYTVTYRVVAGDGHPVSGSFKFSVL
jgi:methionine-rich copper-binding protein CopC